MDYEADNIWAAMKDAKYRDTIAELNSIRMEEFDDPIAFMNNLLAIVAIAVHAEVATLWYYSKYADGMIRPKAVYGGGKIDGCRLSPGEGIAGKVIESGQGIIIEDCRNDARWSCTVDNTTGFITRSMVCIPIIDGSECFGCIQLINRTDGNEFDRKDQVFLEKLSGEVAKIIAKYSTAFVFDEHDIINNGEPWDFNRIFSSSTEEELTDNINKLMAYKTVSGAEAMVFTRCCRKIWRIYDKNKNQRGQKSKKQGKE